jgi:hypothetical protein
MALWPFGREVVPADAVSDAYAHAVALPQKQPPAA